MKFIESDFRPFIEENLISKLDLLAFQRRFIKRFACALAVQTVVILGGIYLMLKFWRQGNASSHS